MLVLNYLVHFAGFFFTSYIDTTLPTYFFLCNARYTFHYLRASCIVSRTGHHCPWVFFCLSVLSVTPLVLSKLPSWSFVTLANVIVFSSMFVSFITV